MIVRTFRIFLDLSKSSDIKKIRSLIRYMVGIWSKFGQGQKLVNKIKIWKVLRMGLPIVENVSVPQESIFSLFRGPQLHFGEQSKNWLNFIKFIDFPLFPLFGVPWAAVIFFFESFGPISNFAWSSSDVNLTRRIDPIIRASLLLYSVKEVCLIFSC